MTTTRQDNNNKKKLQAYEATCSLKRFSLLKLNQSAESSVVHYRNKKIIISDGDEGDGLMEIFLQPVLQTYESREEEYDNWYMLSILK